MVGGAALRRRCARLRTWGWHSYTQSAMPIYEYRCENGHTFEVMQKMTDDPVSVCSTCEAPVQRVFHPVAVHFKGKGFYNTDYGTKRRNRELERSGKSGADKSESGASSSSSDGSGSGSSSGSGSGSGDSSSASKSSGSSSSGSASKTKD
jgi:putative FmdB family regulatory protein